MGTMKFLDRLFSKRQGSQYDGDNAVLVKAMHELALNNNPENLKRMYEELLNSTILIPTPELPTASRLGKESDGDVTLQLVSISDGQGHKLTPAFTDIEALRNWDPNTPCLSAHARGFFETISNHFGDIQGVVINPFDPIRKMIRPAGRITRGEFEVLARGLIPRPQEGGLVGCKLPTAGLGQSVQAASQALPPAVAEVLRRSAESVPEITTLHVFHSPTPTAPPSLLSEWSSIGT
jgi:hypothetical protein